MSPPTGGRAATLKRRLRTIPALFGTAVVAALFAPVLLATAILVDAARALWRRRPWVSIRLVLFGYLYLLAEAVGVIALAVVWAGTAGGLARRPFLDGTYAIQSWWTAALLGGAERLFSLSFHVEGLETVDPGPIIVLARHTSIVDNLLPAQFVTRRRGIRLRYVLKRELLSDPSLDIGGSRLPNYFVDRRASSPRQELEQIRRLATGLSSRDGVLIFPEGTRFTPEKRARIVADMRAGDSAFTGRAERLRHVLPPKLGGVSTLIQAAPEADVVFLAHQGLEGFAHIGDVWNGTLVGRTVSVRFWRVPASEIPTDRSARADWLFQQWMLIDQWIDQRLMGSV